MNKVYEEPVVKIMGYKLNDSGYITTSDLDTTNPSSNEKDLEDKDEYDYFG